MIDIQTKLLLGLPSLLDNNTTGALFDKPIKLLIGCFKKDGFQQ
jgi:hypothetical protein